MRGKCEEGADFAHFFLTIPLKIEKQKHVEVSKNSKSTIISTLWVPKVFIMAHYYNMIEQKGQKRRRDVAVFWCKVNESDL